jgi:hypothetical protein
MISKVTAGVSNQHSGRKSFHRKGRKGRKEEIEYSEFLFLTIRCAQA